MLGENTFIKKKCNINNIMNTMLLKKKKKLQIFRQYKFKQEEILSLMIYIIFFLINVYYTNFFFPFN